MSDLFLSDAERARLLGMTLEEFQSLVGDDNVLTNNPGDGDSTNDNGIIDEEPFLPISPEVPIEPATSVAPAPVISRGELIEKVNAVYKKLGKNFKSKEAFIKWIKEAKKHPKSKGQQTIAKFEATENEFRYRVKDPGQFQKETFRRKDVGGGVSIIIAKRPGSDSMEVQSYRFSKKSFDAKKAKDWIKKHSQKKSKAHIDYVEDLYHKLKPDVVVRRRDHTDESDQVDPVSNKYWDKVPESAAEKALYMGFHVHSMDNPFGLHSHVPGGKLTGGHTHGPQNRSGMHSHREFDPALLGVDVQIGMIQLDGAHVHIHNHIDGGHQHDPENFA